MTFRRVWVRRAAQVAPAVIAAALAAPMLPAAAQAGSAATLPVRTVALTATAPPAATSGGQPEPAARTPEPSPASTRAAAPTARQALTATVAMPGGLTLVQQLQWLANAGVTVSYGDVGQQVAAVQQAVGLTGSDVDGDYGPHTLAAVQAFKTSHGLPATGTVDATVWPALIAAVSPPAATTAPAQPERAIATTRWGSAVRAHPQSAATTGTGSTSDPTVTTPVTTPAPVTSSAPVSTPQPPDPARSWGTASTPSPTGNAAAPVTQPQSWGAPLPPKAPSAPATGGTGSTTPTPPAATPSLPASKAAAIVAFARSKLGTPYQYGGTGPLYDCSGLTQAAYRAAGLTLPRTSEQQAVAPQIQHVSLAQLQPGDLVFFDTGGGDIGHVGIYIGPDQMIDAPHTGALVRAESIQWFGGFVYGGRYIG